MSGTHRSESIARVYVSIVHSPPSRPSAVYSDRSRFSSPRYSVNSTATWARHGRVARERCHGGRARARAFREESAFGEGVSVPSLGSCARARAPGGRGRRGSPATARRCRASRGAWPGAARGRAGCACRCCRGGCSREHARRERERARASSAAVLNLVWPALKSVPSAYLGEKGGPQLRPRPATRNDAVPRTRRAARTARRPAHSVFCEPPLTNEHPSSAAAHACTSDGPPRAARRARPPSCWRRRARGRARARRRGRAGLLAEEREQPRPPSRARPARGRSTLADHTTVTCSSARSRRWRLNAPDVAPHAPRAARAPARPRSGTAR